MERVQVGLDFVHDIELVHYLTLELLAVAPDGCDLFLLLLENLGDALRLRVAHFLSLPSDQVLAGLVDVVELGVVLASRQVGLVQRVLDFLQDAQGQCVLHEAHQVFLVGGHLAQLVLLLDSQVHEVLHARLDDWLDVDPLCALV